MVSSIANNQFILVPRSTWCFTPILLHNPWVNGGQSLKWLSRKTHPEREFPAGRANAIFDYIEIFFYRERLHSQLDYLSLVEHEPRFT